MVGQQKYSTRALPIPNWQVFNAMLGHYHIANITAVSLNIWLIKLVKEQGLIFCNSKFTVYVILKEYLNIHPPFVVSVAVLIINIHRSRAME